MIPTQYIPPQEDEVSSEETTIYVYFNKSELAKIALAAHKKDVTLNQFINDAIREELDQIDS